MSRLLYVVACLSWQYRDAADHALDPLAAPLYHSLLLPHMTDPLQNQLSHRNKYVSASAPDRAPLLPPEYPQASLQLHYEDLITLAARPEEQVSPRARE
jgi:hypothetical protein